jgi:hypothetical protein
MTADRSRGRTSILVIVAAARATENPIAATNLEIGVSGPGHNSIARSPDGKELFVVYHTHADPKRPSDDRVLNIDRLNFGEQGKLRIKGPTRSPQPMPSGATVTPADESRSPPTEPK